MSKTIEQLRTAAQVIKNETGEGRNTANRVGGLFEDIVDYIDEETGGGARPTPSDPDVPLTIDSELSDTSTNPVQNKVIKAAIESIGFEEDRPYDPAQYSGMGKVVLKKNYVNGVNRLTQDMFNKDGLDGSRVPNTNTIYVVRHDYDLGGETIEIPRNSVIDFNGGSFSNGTLTGEGVETDITKLLGKVRISNLNIKNVHTLNSTDFIDSNYYLGSGENVHIGNGDAKTSRLLYKVNPGDVVYIGSLVTDIELGIYTYSKDFKTRGVIGYVASINNAITIPQDVFYLFFTFYPRDSGFVSLDDLRIYVSCEASSIDIQDKIRFNLPATLSSKSLPLSTLYRMWITPSTGNVVYTGSNNIRCFIVSRDVFQGYTHIRVQAGPNGTDWAALKSFPMENHLADFCDDIPSVNGVAGDCEFEYPIPSDCKYLYITGPYKSGNDPAVDYTPKGVTVYCTSTKTVGGLEDAVKKVNGLGICSLRTTEASINVCHWNLGHFSSDGETMHSTITDENFEAKRTAFSNLFSLYQHSNFFFNEYEKVFAKLTDSTYYTNDLIPYYLYNYEGPRRNGIWNAAYIQSPITDITHQEFASYFGRVREHNKNLLISDTYYTVYKFYVGNLNTYLVHTHYPLTSSTGASHKNEGFSEIVSLMQNRQRVVIFGDLNVTDVTYFTDRGYSVANDDTPTHSNGSILDWVLYKGVNIDNFQVVDTITSELSDHNLISFSITVSPWMSEVKGASAFPTTSGSKKPIWYNGSEWVHADGEAIDIKRSGATSERPTPTFAPFMYFDTTLGKPIFWNGEGWTDATGASV